MTRERAMEYLKQQSPEAFLLKAKKRGFVCPVCGNGTGADGDGIVRNPRDGRYHCFKCGEVGGDIFDLIGAAFGLSDFSSQFDKAAELYGVAVERSGGAALNAEGQNVSVPSTVQAREGDGEASAADHSEYFEKCRKNVHMTDFFSKRGISDDIVSRFGLGFDPEFSRGTGGAAWQAAVFPLSEGSFEVRNTAVSPDSSENSRDKYRKFGRAEIFGLSPEVLASDSPLFVCEGIMDALSVIQCGFSAVALGSAANYRLFERAADRYGISCPVVLLLDSDEAGENASKKLSEALMKQSAEVCDGREILGEYHDPNAMLIADPDRLMNALDKFVKRLAPVSEDIKAASENEFAAVNAACCMADFRKYIDRFGDIPVTGTGFNALDDALGGGLYAGLYVFGAVSSLGKTTLLLQIADSIAASGRDVLFFSLEQSRFELMAKSVSRESFLFCRENRLGSSDACSTVDVSDGMRHKGFGERKQFALKGGFDRYGRYADRLFIYEGKGDFTAGCLTDSLRRYMGFRKNAHMSPVIIVDYLQILSPESGRLSDKQAVDRNVTALKQLSRDYDIPLLAVSSLNRSSYLRDVSMEAFKESGAIEYGADVLMGLQFRGAGDNGFDINAARAASPRQIELCILKNRNGAVPASPLPLRYYPAYNFFESAVR